MKEYHRFKDSLKDFETVLSMALLKPMKASRGMMGNGPAIAVERELRNENMSC
jgi:hypothetical protein